jgi:hypothetical protein
VLGDLLDLVHSRVRARLGLVAQGEPGFDPGKDGLEAVLLEALEVGLGEQGQAALGDEVDAVSGHDRLDGVHVVVEPDPEVGVVPGHPRPLHRLEEELQVVLELLEIQGLVGDLGVDAEAAGIGTPQASDHGDDLEKGGLLQRVLDVGPAFPDSRQLEGLLFGGKAKPFRTMGRAVPQDLLDDLLVREAENVIEVLPGVLGIAPGVGAAEHGDRPPGPEQVAEGVGELGGLGEGPDDHEVDVPGELVLQVLESGEAHEGDVVAFLLAPDGNHLGHDAGEIGMHDPGVQGGVGGLGGEIDHRDMELFQTALLDFRFPKGHRFPELLQEPPQACTASVGGGAIGPFAGKRGARTGWG